MRQAGTYTVGQTAIQLNTAERKFIAPARQLEQMATLMSQDILKLVDLLGEPITVRGHTIRPSDIKHDYSCAATFEISDPAIDMQRRRLALDEKREGVRSIHRYMEEAQVSNISEEKMRILLDKLHDHPNIQAALVEEAARMFGLIPLLEKIQEQRAGGDDIPAAVPSGGGADTRIPQPLSNSVPGVERRGQGLAGSGGL